MKIFKFCFSFFTLALILVSCGVKEDISPNHEKRAWSPHYTTCDNTVGTAYAIEGDIEITGSIFNQQGSVDGTVSEGNSRSFTSFIGAYNCTVGGDNNQVLCVTNLNDHEATVGFNTTSEGTIFTPDMVIKTIPVGENLFVKFSANGCDLLFLN